MSESALAILNPATLETLDKLSTNLAQSALIPDSLKGKPRDVLVVLMTGAELGLSPMKALRSISVIKGKPALSADLMVALVKQRGDVCESLELTEYTDKKATYVAKRRGESNPTPMSFTEDDARRAGLLMSDMYKKWPKQMLRARCASMICRAVFPDVCMGLYDADSGELTEGKPLERDVTPSGVQVVEAQALPTPKPNPAKGPTVDVVDPALIGPGSRTAQVRTHVEAFTKVKMPEAYERIKALGEKYGVTGKALSNVVRQATGKTGKDVALLDSYDVGQVHEALEAEKALKAKGYVDTSVVEEPGSAG